MTRILGYLNHLTLYYKRLGPQTEKLHSEFKASPLLYTQLYTSKSVYAH
jgi:hypothetical protein